MTQDEELECIRIANDMYRRLPRYSRVPWSKVVEEATTLYRAGVRWPLTKNS